MISEKSAREFDKYVRKLVKRQPTWLRNLFDEERVLFTLDDFGVIELAVANDVEKAKAQLVQKLIRKYMDKHPSSFLGEIKVQ